MTPGSRFKAWVKEFRNLAPIGPLAKKISRSIFAAILARPFLRELCVLFGFVLLTVVMTWPWARHWRDTVTDLGDPYTIGYTLWWDYHATFNQPTRLFDATIFYPYRDTLAFSEHDYGIALLFFPLFAAGVAPLTVHSLATMAAFAFSAYGAFRLTRTLTGSTSAAWIAGIAFGFVPYRFHRMPHLHYIFAGWLPLVFEALVLFVRQRSWRRAAWLSAAFTMNALTCITWVILGLIPLALCGLLLVLWERAWRDRNLWQRGGMALALSAALLLPFILPYRRVTAEHGFVRRVEDVAEFSATLRHWFAASARTKLWSALGRNVATDEMSLFPGLLAPLLALSSLLFFATRNRRRDDGDVRGDDGRAGGRGAEAPDEETSIIEAPGGEVRRGVDEDVERGRPERGARVEARQSRWLRGVLALLDAGAILSTVTALLAAIHGKYTVELFGVRLLKASHYGRALIIAALLLMVRWVLSRTDLFRILKARGLSVFRRPGLHGQSVLLALAWVVPGFFGSFGVNFLFHRVLFEYVEPFRAIRVPARWAMIAYLGMAVLAGLGARQLAEFLALRVRGFNRSAVVCVLAAALVAELWSAPLAVVRGHALPDALTVRLRETPMRGGIAQLPVFGLGNQTFEHMIRAADHRKPLITATSSYVTPPVTQIHALSLRRPMPAELLDVLEAVPASYLVIDYSQMTPEEIAAVPVFVRGAIAAGRLRFCGRFEDRGTKDLFALVKTEPGALSAGVYAPPRVLQAKAGEQSDPGPSLTPEILQGGTVLHRFYKASYSRAPTYAEFKRDLPALAGGIYFGDKEWPVRLAANAAVFAAGWVDREEFRKAYGGAGDRQYVDTLTENASRDLFDRARREQLAADLSAGKETRAGALLRIVNDEGFARRESDAAFVTLHYFYFLERDPEPEGLTAWLRALEVMDRDSVSRSFTASIEYQAKRNARR